jgi:hypothetical protein
MPKNARVVLTTLFAVAFVGLTIDYFPPTRMGFFLSSCLFVLAAYPIYRALEAGTDRTFVVGAVIFVPITLAMHELKAYLPTALIRYSAAVMVTGSFVIMFNKIFGARQR